MGTLLQFPGGSSLAGQRPGAAGNASGIDPIEARIAILEEMLRLLLRDTTGFKTPEMVLLQTRLKAAVKTNSISCQLSAEEQAETLRYAQRLLAEIYRNPDA